MEALILAVYSFFVWLIFIKFKWLPWNTVSQVTVVIIPIVAITALILFLNVYAPSSSDVRVIKYVVQIVPQVRGQVIEVPIEGNSPVKKGDVLFKIDPTPYQIAVDTLSASLAATEGSVKQLNEQLRAAQGKTETVRAQLELGRMRVTQNRDLVSNGAGDRFTLEQAESNVKQLQSELNANVAAEAQIRARLGATVGDDQAEVAQIKSQLANARWELSQTVFTAPADGTVINLQLRPGQMATALGMLPVMTFVEDDYQVLAMFGQNELHQVDKGNEVEITLDTYPGRVIKGHVDSIIWAQGQGQIEASGDLPKTTFVPPPGRFPVKVVVDEKDKAVFMAAGARGAAAIYTEHLALIHIVRKVLLRVASYLDYIIIKHSIHIGH